MTGNSCPSIGMDFNRQIDQISDQHPVAQSKRLFWPNMPPSMQRHK